MEFLLFGVAIRSLEIIILFYHMTLPVAEVKSMLQETI